jgi:hypothetical protein
MRSQIELQVARAYLDILAAMAEIPARKLGVAVRFTETPIERIDTSRVPMQVDVRLHMNRAGRLSLGNAPTYADAAPSQEAVSYGPRVESVPDLSGIRAPGVRPIVRRTKRLEKYLRAGISPRRSFLGETSGDPEIRKNTLMAQGYRTRRRLERLLLLFEQEPFLVISPARLKYRVDEIKSEARGLYNRAVLNKFDVDGLNQTEDEMTALLIRARELVIFSDTDDASGLSGAQAEEIALRFVRRRLRRQTERIQESKRRLEMKERKLKILTERTELVQGPIEMIDFEPTPSYTDRNLPDDFMGFDDE